MAGHREPAILSGPEIDISGRGFPQGKPIGTYSVIDELAPTRTSINDAQRTIIRALQNDFGALTVSAPSYIHSESTPFVFQYPTGSQHHLGEKAVDFSGPLTDLMRAFLSIEEAGWKWGVGLGLSGGPRQYGADTHLHVDLISPARQWFEVDKKPVLAADGAQLGFKLKIIMPGDRVIWQYFGKPQNALLSSVKVPGIWDQTLSDARKLYGYDGPADDAAVETIWQSMSDDPSDYFLPLVAATIVGAALGWDDKQPAKKWIYAGAALVLAYVVLNIRKSLKLLPAT